MGDRWAPKPVQGIPDGTVLYDGVCVICSAAFRFVAASDPEARFKFTAVQDRLGQRMARLLGIDAVMPESNAVVIDGIAYMKSDAAIQVLARLPRYGWARHLRHVPRGLRNWVYDRVARNRYRLFGKTETCLVPGPELRRHVARDE
ncbi:thiol-disulfide oxidoreductase DCC family protein [Falsiroseomonas stagni]|uniref:Predicted thiol-disulfide oxidoreductase YuxK, DCC family n=1 Tax=Falsiroseomonas stagni DSM 19981 TaxID=1123062 RepID=A0A1I4BYR4_9PROT|nr:DCC1-like thiol-disulfide oxidoreductase family protein [Falsiroseomonas stagni]SFK73239.1 Predicted thiol-disulfide oxidoreductase YuxK, DCC family [Falsiroseomonas stagni DSM 19981]